MARSRLIIHPLILVSGSRFHNGKDLIESTLARTVEELLEGGLFSILIHGKCKTGADMIADRWGRRQLTGIQDVQGMDANWTRYGRAAGPIRNENLVERAWVQQNAGGKVVVLAFPLGESTGTYNLIDTAKAAGLKDVRVING